MGMSIVLSVIIHNHEAVKNGNSCSTETKQW